jgi:hypothetical protein
VNILDDIQNLIKIINMSYFEHILPTFLEYLYANGPLVGLVLDIGFEYNNLRI